MIRVLHIFGGLGTGGTESLIMSWYRNIDRSKVQFDFLVRSPDNNYVEEIASLGGRVFYTAAFPRHFVRNYRQIKAILAKKEWDVIHVHGNAAMYVLPLRLAKKLGYAHRIMHSHSVKAQNLIFRLVHTYNSKIIQNCATCCLACSTQAGRWMYNSNDFRVLRNSIETKKYLFSHEVREEYRKIFQIENSFLIGHVGRLAMPKNHNFLLDVFYEVKKKKPNSKLILVGDGELQEAIVQKARLLNIDSDIIFTGRRTDIGALLSAMDMFVLPSLYEGLGIVLVEAQCNGLPCVVSQEAYNEEVSIYPKLLSVRSLSSGAEDWADHILQKVSNQGERNVDLDVWCDCGYDMRTEIAKLEELYLQAEKG